MCGRYASYMAPDEVQLQFDLERIDEQAERFVSYNVAPSTDIPVIVQRPDTGRREMLMARWGLVPRWAKDLSGPLMFNARLESVAEKRAFAPSLATRRCIVPMSGYFEWQAGGGPNGSKQPYFIFDASQPVTAMAGLYSWWHQEDGTWLLSATIITRAATAEMAAIHSREPALLRPEEYAAWLDPAQKDPLAALALLQREPPTYTYFPVGNQVGNVANNSAANVEKIIR